MATRHSIVHIEFQANAGKANAALKALQSEAARTKAEVERLRGELSRAKAANLPTDQIQKLEAELKKARTEHRQWQSALDNNLKGVRALDEAIKMFNKGKGSVEGMNAALSKTALNAAKLQQNRSGEGSKTWKEMDALAVALNQNIMRCNTALNQMIGTIKSGGSVSKSTLTQAKTDLQQMIALEEQGSKGWVKYTGQLKVVEGALNKLAAEEQRMAAQNVMSKVFSGQYVTKSRSELEKMIATLQQYQATIQDPKGNGARHFNATETAIKRLSEQLAKTKGDVASVQQALKIAGAAGTATRFGSGLDAQGNKLAQAFGKVTERLNQLKQARAGWVTGISGDAAQLAKLDAQLATTAARQERLRNEMIKVGEVNNLTAKGINQSIAILRQQQETVAAGSPAWQKYEAAILKLEDRMKIMRGEAMSLFDAMRLSQKAGGQGFTGTAQQLQMAQQAIEKAAAAARKGSPEWQKFQQALARVRVEMQNTGMTSERMRAIISRPANAKNLNELATAVKRAKAELALMEGTVGRNSKAYAQMAEQTKKAEIQLKQLQGQSHGTASAFDKAWSRLKTYVGLYVGAAVAMQKVVSTFSDLMDLSDKMGEVRKTTGFTADEVGRLVENLKKIDVRTGIVSLVELSAAAGQLGLKTEEDVQGFTEAANKLMIALPEMGKDAATQMMKVAIATGEVDKIRKQMQEGTVTGSSATAIALTKVGSTIDQLRANSAAAAPAITDFVKRVGAVGAQSGISLDQVAALGSTVDALGMRTEMAATALSRMIPAIRANAFDLAKVVNVAPDTLRNLFDTGRGMEAILMIFQHIKDSGMSEDSIEQMLGMGNMKEIMKELNQMGARAGIVFSGLSQNVDELRRQLGVASQAYEENMAVEREFQKMNETTAAKWARLKNQLEEAFVGDSSQKFLGRIIDSMRNIVDLLTDNVVPAWKAVGTIIKTILTYWALKSMGIVGIFPKMIQGLKNIGITLGVIRGQLSAMDKANIFTALLGATAYLGYRIYNAATAVSELDKALNQLEEQWGINERKINRLVVSLTNATTKSEEAAKKQKDLEDQTEALRKEVDELKKSTDKSTEATDALSKKEDELKQSEDDLKKATDASNKANDERKKLIAEINSNYSSYLGYMLSEASTADQVASAHMRIVAALKEEWKQKGLQKKLESIEDEHKENLKEYQQDSRDELKSLPRDAQDYIMERFRSMMETAYYEIADKDGQRVRSFVLPAIEGLSTQEIRATDEADLLRKARPLMRQILKEETLDKGIGLGQRTANVSAPGVIGGSVRVKTPHTLDTFLNNIWGGNGDDGFMIYGKELLSQAREMEVERNLTKKEVDDLHGNTVKKTIADIETNANEIARTLSNNQQLTDNQLSELARTTNSIVQSIKKYDSEITDVEKYVGKGNEVSLENAVNTMFATLSEQQRRQILNAARKAERAGTGDSTFRSPTVSTQKLWGSDAPADSTDYSLFDVNELVARRNQMDKFKNILKPDTDVRTVLAEDKALMKALDNGLKSDWKSVLDWYNAERKKIQDELKSERFSTNTGHWRDEKNGRGRKNRFRESDYALAELDRYYSRRKEKLEKAREEEGMSEELFNREAELLEQEHLERRSKLRETFTAGTSKQEQEMVAQFRQWWDKLEKSGDLDEVPWATVESEWSNALASEIGRNNLKAQQDLTQLQSITVKHLNAIAKLIDQERPYDGITANLRKNLTEMDILLADMVKDGPAEDTAKLVSEQGKRLQFLLTEAEHAYALTFDDLQKKMREQGLGDWADALMIDEQKKQSLMQNLRNVYDQIQEAIKKEASIIKKQLEIQWNDMLPGQEMSMKGTFEKAISDLGLAGDQVKRANSLIGAGAASERVADRLAIQQMKVQLAMQQTYFAMMQKIGDERVRQLRLSAEANEHDAKALKAKAEQLRREGKITEAETKEREAEIAARQALQDSFDAEHAQKSLNLAKTKEIVEEEKQRVAIQNQLEESQNRLYQELKSWADLLASSLQNLIDAYNTGNAEYYNNLAKLNLTGGSDNAEYYNELAKLNLTGKGGPGAGSYVVIDNAGTENATAHYEYLDERAALERQRQLSQQQRYIVTDHAGTSDATAHYETLTEEEYLKRQHEIEQQNATAEAWKKVMDDLSEKMNKTITDQLNAMLQNTAIDTNTQALNTLTTAVNSLNQTMGSQPAGNPENDPFNRNSDGFATDDNGQMLSPVQPTAPSTGETMEGMPRPMWQVSEEDLNNIGLAWQSYKEQGLAAQTEMAETMAEIPGSFKPPFLANEEETTAVIENMGLAWQSYSEQGLAAQTEMADITKQLGVTTPTFQLSDDEINKGLENTAMLYQNETNQSNIATQQITQNLKKIKSESQNTNNELKNGTNAAFAAMTQAANLYGIAYQVMSNNNLSAAQKAEVFALQAAGQASIAMLQGQFYKSSTGALVSLPKLLADCLGINPIAGAAIFAVLSALIGGAIGLASSKLAKGKSEITSTTNSAISSISPSSGASVSAGRLATGMMTYAEGNVNELTDPASLTPGRQYNVDGADGKTYRARYMGKGAKTHITNGPEFHLVGEAGREAIIDAKTTRLLQMNETGIWRDIQTLYNGGSISGMASRRRRGGMPAFADGNIGEFEEMAGGGGLTAEETGGMGIEQMLTALDRNSAIQEALLERLNQPIYAQNILYGPDGLPNVINKLNKEAQRHGEEYL